MKYKARIILQRVVEQDLDLDPEGDVDAQIAKFKEANTRKDESIASCITRPVESKAVAAKRDSGAVAEAVAAEPQARKAGARKSPRR